MSDHNMIFFCAVAAVLLLDKLCLVQAQLHRPIVLCTVLGFMAGDGVSGAFIGSLWEFVWSREQPLGANIPPDESASAALHMILFIATPPMEGSEFERASLLFVAVFPAGYLFGMAERFVRRMHNGIAAVIENRADMQPGIGMLHLSGLVTYAAMYFSMLSILTLLLSAAYGRMALSSDVITSAGRDVHAVVVIISGAVVMRRYGGRFLTGLGR